VTCVRNPNAAAELPEDATPDRNSIADEATPATPPATWPEGLVVSVGDPDFPAVVTRFAATLVLVARGAVAATVVVS